MAQLIPRPNYPPYGANSGDAGRREADALLWQLEHKVHRTYEQAAREMKKKADDYLQFFMKEDARRAEMVANGTLSAEEYKQWRISHIATGRRWYEMAYVLATDQTNANQIAASMINGYLPDVFAVGYNYSLYQGELTGGFQTSFTLYDRETVIRLMRDDPELLPKTWIDTQKDTAWNQKQFNAAMTQAIIQGESIDEIAARLVSTVGGMNERSAIRNARTAFTSAENGGRYDAARRLKNAGVDLALEWCATLDGRTRHTHRLLDGERRNVDEPFECDGYNIMYAGDPQAPQKLIWNCRCTLLTWVKDFEPSLMLKARSYPDNMTYAEWKFGKVQDEKHKIETSQKSDNESNRKSGKSSKSKHRINPDNPSYGYPDDIENAMNHEGYAVDMGDLYEQQSGDYDAQPIQPKKKKKKGK